MVRYLRVDMSDALRLERRPEARSYAIEDLLQLVRDGKIRLPEFQRPQRWRSSHVVDLFDSIYRGLPIGTLLFAKREADSRWLHFGPLSFLAPRVADGLFMVDGQQRMTALAAALLHPAERPRGDIHAIWFDLEEERFRRYRGGTVPHHWIPLNVVGDSFKQLGWLNDWHLRSERPDLVRKALALGKATREYQVPAYVVEAASEEALRLIFKRTNTSGVAMQEAEVFEALYGATDKPSLRAAISRLAETGFGEIPEDWFLRCLKSVEGMDPRERFISEKDLDVSRDAVEKTELALRRAIAFLIGWAGIPHQQMLPYRLPLLILARFFSLFPQPDPRTCALLVRWIWRGALSVAHGDTGDVTISELQAKIGDDMHAAVEALVATVPRDVKFPSSLAAWNGRSAHTRLCALAMFHLGARMPGAPEALDVEDLQELLRQRHELGEVFRELEPPAGPAGQTTLWGGVEEPTKKAKSSIAERFLLSDRSALELTLAFGAEGMRSHGLDEEAASAYHRGDYAAFLERRAALLDEGFKRFFRERCALGESDRPSIAAIVQRVEGSAA